MKISTYRAKIFFVALYMIKVYICIVKISIHESKAARQVKSCRAALFIVSLQRY